MAGLFQAYTKSTTANQRTTRWMGVEIDTFWLGLKLLLDTAGYTARLYHVVKFKVSRVYTFLHSSHTVWLLTMWSRRYCILKQNYIRAQWDNWAAQLKYSKQQNSPFPLPPHPPRKMRTHRCLLYCSYDGPKLPYTPLLKRIFCEKFNDISQLYLLGVLLAPQSSVQNYIDRVDKCRLHCGLHNVS